jgi:hypothetical protein
LAIAVSCFVCFFVLHQRAWAAATPYWRPLALTLCPGIFDESILSLYMTSFIYSAEECSNEVPVRGGRRAVGKPIVGIVGCCVRVEIGQAAAASLKRAMNCVASWAVSPPGNTPDHIVETKAGLCSTANLTSQAEHEAYTAVAWGV